MAEINPSNKDLTKASFELSIPNPSKEATELMQFLKGIYGKGMLAGQHITDAKAPEIDFLEKLTGKKPALLGIDLLSSSPSADESDCSEETAWEIKVNRGCVNTAIDWATKQKGIVTASWHWFSPNGAKGDKKSFYTGSTDFNLKKALDEKSDEYALLLRDIDAIAVELKKFQNANVPLLWRPLHEPEGRWFWWGNSGPDCYKELYGIMYDRLVSYHNLNNLIWVWNSPSDSWKVDDSKYDIASVDIYVPSKEYVSHKKNFESMQEITGYTKPIALGENGPLPNPDLLHSDKASWLWNLTWWGDFCTTDKSTDYEYAKAFYNHPYIITLDKLQ